MSDSRESFDAGYAMERAEEARRGVPVPCEGAWREGRPEHPGQHRIAPRECVREANEYFMRAYGETEYAKAVHHLRHGIDWLRRALEQMAPLEEGDGA